MDPRHNPFAPGAGTQPPELAGRAGLIEGAEVAIERVLRARPAQSQVFVGLRGVGKTVLLNRIWSDADRRGCKAILLEATERRPFIPALVPELRRLLISFDVLASTSEKVKRAIRVLRSFTNGLKVKAGELEFEFTGVDPERGTADSGNLETDLSELMVVIAEAAQDRKSAIILCIDELQNLSEVEFSALIMGVHRLNQRGLPFVLMGAGLPQILALAGRSKSYAERLFQFPEVGPLDSADASAALQLPVQAAGVSFSETAIAAILHHTQGYPYLLQEWGKEAWNVATTPRIGEGDVERAASLVISNLDRAFFRVRFNRLTPGEQQYLRALANFGPGSHRSGQVAALLNVSTNKLGPKRDSVIRKGMVYSPSHGEVAFTVPLFDEFMKRILPGENIETWGSPLSRSTSMP